MLRLPRSGQWSENTRFVVTLLFLAACCLWGGGARLDIPGLAIVQPFAVLCILIVLLTPGPIHLQTVKAPILLLAALAIIMIVQLIPLPPALRTQLPGHGAFAEVAIAAGIGQPWRPISLTPDLTIGSLIGLVVPAAALLCFASLSQEQTFRLLPYLLGAAAVSVLFGLAQIVGGPQSGFYRYEITNHGAAVGLFSNRNHQAVLLAMVFPMLALWVAMPAKDPRNHTFRLWVAGAGAIFLLPMLAVTGSRAGLLLGVMGLGLAWMQFRIHRYAGKRDKRARQFSARVKIAAAGVGILVFVAAIFFSRAEAVERLFATNFSDDPRAQYTPVLIRMARDFFPFGTGFGSFDPIFRFYEPFELLQAPYFNHAHNDFLEIIITGGLPAALLAVGFLIWAVPAALAAMRAGNTSRSNGFARLACAMIVIMLASSLVDYPLRTPLLSALFAIACGWLAPRRSRPPVPADRGG